MVWRIAKKQKDRRGTLRMIQAELIANNLPTDIVGVNKVEYEKAKSNKRSQLLAKALK